jgi:hypothetical protein
MSDTESPENAVPITTVEYELTDDVACQLAVDLVALRMPAPPARPPGLGGLNPVVVLVGAAVQIVIAMAALVLLGGWQWIVSKFLVAAGVVVTGILLWKAAFYSFPSFARWYACRRAMRNARGLAHRRIRWLIYKDHLETESASAPRRTAWSDVTQMTPYGQSIILSLNSGLELVIPASVLSAETRSIIEHCITRR